MAGIPDYQILTQSITNYTQFCHEISAHRKAYRTHPGGVY
jgi:hypothetical protein